MSSSQREAPLAAPLSDPDWPGGGRPSTPSSGGGSDVLPKGLGIIGVILGGMGGYTLLASSSADVLGSDVASSVAFLNADKWTYEATVLDTGIAYSGTCRENETEGFALCEVADGEISELCPGLVKDVDASEERRLRGQAAAARGHFHGAPAPRCTRRYLPWLRVRVQGPTSEMGACAYEYGTQLYQGSKKRSEAAAAGTLTETSLRSGSTLQVWSQIYDGRCIVGFGAISLLEHRVESLEELHDSNLAMGCAEGVLALCCLCSAACAWASFHMDRAGLSWLADRFAPDADNEDGPGNDRTKDYIQIPAEELSPS